MADDLPARTCPFCQLPAVFLKTEYYWDNWLDVNVAIHQYSCPSCRTQGTAEGEALDITWRSPANPLENVR